MSLKYDCPHCGAKVSASLYECPLCDTELDECEIKRAKEKINAWVDSYYLEILREHEVNVSKIVRQAIRRQAQRFIK